MKYKKELVTNNYKVAERLPRYFAERCVQHIIQRGNNRDIIFAAEEDYRFYLECLQEASLKHGLAIHAYVLMTNHVHLLASPEHKDSIPKTMQSLGRRYVQYFNYHYKRTGTLWEGRYKATLVDSDQYFFICSRYIELNPVRANMVAAPLDYPWSSHGHNAYGKKDPLIIEHQQYVSLSKNVEERANAYRQLFNIAISDELLEKIRESTNKGWALGNGQFSERVAELTERRSQPLARGRPKGSNKR